MLRQHTLAGVSSLLAHRRGLAQPLAWGGFRKARGLFGVGSMVYQGNRNPALYPVLLALTMGARRSELLALRWRDVNLLQRHTAASYFSDERGESGGGRRSTGTQKPVDYTQSERSGQ